MDTQPKPSQERLLEWLREGLESGRLKLQPIQDEAGRILLVNIVLDDQGEIPPLKGERFDPRKTRPL
jgi:hypothetical protein